MATLHVVPATTGLGIVFEPEHRRKHHASYKADVYIYPSLEVAAQPRSTATSATAQYLSLLLQQKADLHREKTVSRISIKESATVEKRSLLAMARPGFAGLRNVSIADTEIFKILYNKPEHLTSFVQDQTELHFEIVQSNIEFQKFVANKEPGMKIDYKQLRADLRRLKKQDPSLVEKSPAIFRFFQDLLAKHKIYLLYGSQFLSFDLFSNMIQAYYGDSSDTSLLTQFPVKQGKELEGHIKATAYQVSEEANHYRTLEWLRRQDDWLQAEKDLMALKASSNLAPRFRQLEKLTRIFKTNKDAQLEDKIRKRAEKYSGRVMKRQVIKESNNRHVHQQYGQQGMHVLSDALSTAIVRVNQRHNIDYIADDLPNAFRQVDLEDHPDSMAKLMPETDNEMRDT